MLLGHCAILSIRETMIEVTATPKFMRLAKKSMTKDALQKLIDTLAISPDKGSLIKGGYGIRKIRWITGKGQGKRGGLRVIYYYDGSTIVILLLLYKKSDQEDIDSNQKEELKKLIQEILGY